MTSAPWLRPPQPRSGGRPRAVQASHTASVQTQRCRSPRRRLSLTIANDTSSAAAGCSTIHCGWSAGGRARGVAHGRIPPGGYFTWQHALSHLVLWPASPSMTCVRSTQSVFNAKGIPRHAPRLIVRYAQTHCDVTLWLMHHGNPCQESKPAEHKGSWNGRRIVQAKLGGQCPPLSSRLIVRSVMSMHRRARPRGPSHFGNMCRSASGGCRVSVPKSCYEPPGARAVRSRSYRSVVKLASALQAKTFPVHAVRSSIRHDVILVTSVAPTSAVRGFAS